MIIEKIYLSPSNQYANTYSYGNTNEMEQCNRIAEAAEKALLRNKFQVKRAPKGQDMDVSISESNAWGADIHIPIHTNAGGGCGPLVMVYSKADANMKYAQPVYDQLEAIAPQGGGYGVRKDSDLLGFTLAEIRNTNGIAVYIEAEFHDDAQLAQWIIDNVEELGEAICKGICSAEGKTYIPPKETEEEKPSEDKDFAIGDIVYFKGGNHYPSANSNTGYKVEASKARVTALFEGGKHPVHVRAVTPAGNYTYGVYGWVDESSLTYEEYSNSRIPTLDNLKIGDIVTFVGNTHYPASSSRVGSSVWVSKAKVTALYPTGRHPVHLRAVDANHNYIAGVYGWVDLDDIRV